MLKKALTDGIKGGIIILYRSRGAVLISTHCSERHFSAMVKGRIAEAKRYAVCRLCWAQC